MDDTERRLTQRLERVMRPQLVPVWLETPIDALDGETPTALLRRGEHDRLLKLVSELEDPGAV